MVSKSDYVSKIFQDLDSRGKGKLDMLEVRKLLTVLQPDLATPPNGVQMLRAVLCHIHLWDPSTHAVLSRKHVMQALRMDKPDASLYPTPSSIADLSGDKDDVRSVSRGMGGGYEAHCPPGSAAHNPGCPRRSTKRVVVRLGLLGPCCYSFTQT